MAAKRQVTPAKEKSPKVARAPRSAVDIARAPDRPANHVTKSDFARLMTKHPDAVATWINRDGMPTVRRPDKAGDDYVLDMTACVIWLVTNKDYINGKFVKRKSLSTNDPDAPLDTLSYEARGIRAKSLMAEVQLDRELEETVYVDELISVVVEILVRSRTSMLEIASRVGPMLEGLTSIQIVEKLEKAIDGATSRLSEGFLVDEAFADAAAIRSGAAIADDET